MRFLTLGLLSATAVFGCNGGEVYLPAGVSGGSLNDDVQGTGGTNAAGGSLADPTGTGGVPSAHGGADPDDDPDDEPDDGFPFDVCEDEPEMCACVSPLDCPPHRPRCDEALGACVECLEGPECFHRYGYALPFCSAGRCVACQVSEHCPPGSRCLPGGMCEDF